MYKVYIHIYVYIICNSTYLYICTGNFFRSLNWKVRPFQTFYLHRAEWSMQLGEQKVLNDYRWWATHFHLMLCFLQYLGTEMFLNAWLSTHLPTVFFHCIFFPDKLRHPSLINDQDLCLWNLEGRFYAPCWKALFFSANTTHFIYL